MRNREELENLQRLSRMLDGAFYNPLMPHIAPLQHEKPHHRVMADLMAKGYSKREVAQMTGYHPMTVANAAHQPFFQEHMIETLRNNVQDELKEILESELKPTLRKVLSIRDDPTAPHAVQLNACSFITDRLFGKPNQPITTQEIKPSELTNDELNARVSRLVEGMATPTAGPEQS